MIVYRDHLQILTPRRVRDTLLTVYSARGENTGRDLLPGAGGLIQSNTYIT